MHRSGEKISIKNELSDIDKEVDREVVSDTNLLGAWSYNRNVSQDEIRLAVWNCRENKSLGPDGYTFEFFRIYWNIVVDEGCGVMHNQFRYFGVMVGECMSRHQAWEDTVLKLRSRLSNWKVKTLSIGGRLTILKSVLGASPLYNMSIFKSHDRWFCDLTGDGEFQVKE
nr:RNA-directed DNA polymerase, eukaryota [Tanacetum cinerariifolium]